MCSPRLWGRNLAAAQTLHELTLGMRPSCALAWAGMPRLVAGLAGLTRSRALTLALDSVCVEATLPACLSRLARLTSLHLCGLDGLRCAPGWARLPALRRLITMHCAFACDGEAALPGIDALVSLTHVNFLGCPSLRVLPTSLWRLTRLRTLTHSTNKWELADMPRDELPTMGLPARAPCFAALIGLNLDGLNLPAFPPSILAMTRLEQLNLPHSCFELLPEGMSVLTALRQLRLGRHAAGGMEVGGAVDARPLGSLAAFPHLRHLWFENCSVLFSPSIVAAAVHPRLQEVLLSTAYPASGPSCQAFLGLVTVLLQQGRARILHVAGRAFEGAGHQDGRNFTAALQAVGFPLQPEVYGDYNDESASEGAWGGDEE